VKSFCWPVTKQQTGPAIVVRLYAPHVTFLLVRFAQRFKELLDIDR